MIARATIGVAAAGLLLAGLAAGCKGLSIDIPGFTTVTLEIVNDSPFDVDPRMVTSDSQGGFSDIFTGGGDDLATGILAPGDKLVYNFDCDSLQRVFSDAPEQLDDGELAGAAQPSRVLKQDRDFECGDTVRFRFIGTGQNFGVIVSRNGAVIGS